MNDKPMTYSKLTKVSGFLLMIGLILLTGCQIEIRNCVETREPICLPLPQSDLEKMADEIESDVEEMLPNNDFEYWVEDGCIHACEYKEVSSASSQD